MKFLIILSSIFLFACRNTIDFNKVERRSDGLSYLKGTNILVNGHVIEQNKGGKILSRHNFKHGMPIGNWYAYDQSGQVASHGFGIEIDKYQDSLTGQNLKHSILSIVIQKGFNYATLDVADSTLFDRNVISKLSDLIFNEYSESYSIDDMLMFDSRHEYNIRKKATGQLRYVFDTIPDKGKIRLNIY